MPDYNLFSSGITYNDNKIIKDQAALAELAKSGVANHNNTQHSSFCARSDSQKCRFLCFFLCGSTKKENKRLDKDTATLVGHDRASPKTTTP